MKIFLDDERNPVGNDWVVARSVDQFKVAVLAARLPITYISFDHDLGDCPSGMDAANWLIEYDIDNDVLSSTFDFYVHSMNPIGRENIRSKLSRYLELKREIGLEKFDEDFNIG